ncbi:MAG: hypothetical protein U0746_05195 [Gemmataceae bacterium]
MRIGNEASVISLVYFFRHACRDEDGRVGTGISLDHVLGLLEAYRTPRGLKAILECAEWCEANKGLFLPRGLERESPPSNWVSDLVSSKRPDSAKWRTELTELPEGGLSERQREMVALAKKAVNAR